jgi:tripartite ATP-independent transporter DctP family solute receptor
MSINLKPLFLTTIFCLILFTGPGTAISGKAVALKWGHIYPVTSEIHEAVALANHLIQQRSNGKLKVDIFPGAQLGGMLDEVENTKMGMQDLAMTWGGLSRYCPSFKLFNFPFLYRDQHHLYNVFNSDIGQKEIHDYLLEKHGLRIVGMLYAGARNLTTTDKYPVKSPSDMKGVRLRTPDDPTWIKAWGSIGAKVTSFPWGELYMALKQGVVDAQENPLPSIRAMKFYEVQKNIILTEHVYTYEVIMMNEKKFQSLGKDFQKVLLDSVEDARLWSLAKIEEATRVNAKYFKEQGLNIVPIDKAEWIEAFSGAPALFEGGAKMYKKIQAID